jgi:2-methylcitrate dehydratase PrpD
VPFALASILYHGRSGLKSFDEAAVANPAVQALVQRVYISEDPSFTARFPQEQPVTVRIVMKSGTAHEGRCVVTKGEPTKPHTSAELTGKFFELGEPVWGRPVTQQLYDGLMRLEEIADFRAFADELAL